jgi:hypothetical protein
MSDMEGKVAQGSHELPGRVASFKHGLKIGTNDSAYTHPCKSLF